MQIQLTRMVDAGSTSATEEYPAQLLVECITCKNAASTPVSHIECQILLNGGLFSRRCDRCGKKTMCKLAVHSAVGEPVERLPRTRLQHIVERGAVRPVQA